MRWSKRVRDPVHGLIVFESELDALAWKLIETPEFQRMRRIRQLGVSEFTFPGAIHTRFAHSIGVYHNARQLIDIIKREIGADFDDSQAQVAQIAALLHDVGHGPFSHTFEGVQKSRGIRKRHEQWTADIIRNPNGRIFPLLEGHRTGFGDAVASLLEREDPEHIYHAVVSSSFDADRLDYLRRDKLMTGTGAGAIDFDWLVDNLRIAEIAIDPPEGEDDDSRRVPTFCFTAKALPAAEQFLLARYTLHQQVYFHKTTRCVEHMIGKLLRLVARRAGDEGQVSELGLLPSHPLIRFLATECESVDNYLALDDQCIWGILHELRAAQDVEIADLAGRLLDRRLYKTLDIAEFGSDAGRQQMKLRGIKKKYAADIEAERIMIDEEAKLRIYSEVGGDDEKRHKKIHILDGGSPKEIIDIKVSPVIYSLKDPKQFTRVYFADEAQRDEARNGTQSHER